jgi:hypothetical protein
MEGDELCGTSLCTNTNALEKHVHDGAGVALREIKLVMRRWGLK